MLNLPTTLRASSRSILSCRAAAPRCTQARNASSLGSLLSNISGQPSPPAQTSSEPSDFEAGPPTAGPDGYPPPQPTFSRAWGDPTRNATTLGIDEDSLQEADGGEDANAFTRINLTKLKLHCHSTPNNTITTLTKANGSTIAWFSGGSCGFKKGNRATYEAGYQCAVRAFKKIEQLNIDEGGVAVDLYFKGFGEGRNALKGALLATEGAEIRGLVTSITDRTPIKIGGTRAKKMPRN
ncbi:mitochondrial ribosomal protein subunit S18 [Coprinopsis sp. MPI-PUGE-AT-0042]|nr:mitochondrial ribosomal protein subunit S18 [Coprinopsis sp. MPI-PUGE-AT-0042]